MSAENCYSAHRYPSGGVGDGVEIPNSKFRIQNSLLVRVLDAGTHQNRDVVVGDAVKDHPSFAAGSHQVAIAEQAQLVTDGGDRELGKSGEVTYAEFLGDREGMEDLEAGWIGESGEEPAQTLNR